MKLVVSFYGLCLCVLEGRKGNRATSATVLLLNGAAPQLARKGSRRAAPLLPFHHPLLFVPAAHADVARSDWSPVPAADTLVDLENLISGRTHAWGIAGLDLTLGRGRGITLYENQTADAAGRLADPGGRPDGKVWLDWRRIPDLSRIAPGAKVRTAYRRIGAHVLGAIRFKGGELRGASPKDAAGLTLPWTFSRGFSQVVTDRFEFHCELPGNELSATGYASGKKQAIRLRNASNKVVRLSIVHEASQRDLAIHRQAKGGPARVALRAGTTELPHYTGFYSAIEGSAVARLKAPRAGQPVRTGARLPAQDSPVCPPALI